MRNTNLKISLAFTVATLFLSACNKEEEEKLSGDDMMDVTAESLTDSYFEDVDGMATEATKNGNSPTGGRIAADERFTCAVISFTETSDDVAGDATVDFSANDLGYCQDPKGNVRKGKIHIAYLNGPAGQIGFTTITTFENYSINDIKLEGTRTVERVEPSEPGRIKHEVTLVDGKATWPDNVFATRDANFTGEWVIGDGTYLVDGSASGLNRRGKDYTMIIAETLVYKLQCTAAGIYMATEGAKIFTTSGGGQLTIDFGAGECDRIVTASIGAISSDVVVGKN